MPRKWPWLLAGLIAAALFVGWLRPRTDSSGDSKSDGQASLQNQKTTHSPAKPSDADRKEKNATLRAASPEARKHALMEAFAKTLKREGSRDANIQECWQILRELAKVADFHEMVALIEAYPEAAKDRSSLLAAVFGSSRLPVPELVALAKGMSEDDQGSAINGLGEKFRQGKDPKDYAVLSELATTHGLIHCFNIALSLDLVPHKTESRQTRFTELAALASTISTEHRATYEVMVAALGRREAPELAWEAISGESPAGKTNDELRALTLQRMIEKDPITAMTSLMRDDDDLVTGLTQWLAKDHAAAKAWYAGLEPMQLLGPRGERLSKLVNK